MHRQLELIKSIALQRGGESKGQNMIYVGFSRKSQPNVRASMMRLGPDAGGEESFRDLTPFRRYYAVFIFTLTASMLYADQNLMAPLLSPIAAEFGFNDEEKYK